MRGWVTVTPTTDEPERRFAVGSVVLGGAGLVGLAPKLAALLPVPVLDSLDCALVMACRGGRAPAHVAQAPQTGLEPKLAAMMG